MMGDMPNENTNQTEPVECMCQGSHGDRMRVVTTDAPALEHAMDLDDDVLEYEVVDDAADEEGRKTPAGWRP
jgi:hypothetical protein